jgi:hypothetical protein
MQYKNYLVSLFFFSLIKIFAARYYYNYNNIFSSVNLKLIPQFENKKYWK